MLSQVMLYLIISIIYGSTKCFYISKYYSIVEKSIVYKKSEAYCLDNAKVSDARKICLSICKQTFDEKIVSGGKKDFKKHQSAVLYFWDTLY